MWNAFVVEEQRNAAVRALAGRAAQALALLHTLASHNVNRLAARLDDASRRKLGEVVSILSVYVSPLCWGVCLGLFI